MSDCCILGRFPKKYLYTIKNGKGELVNLFLSEKDHLEIQKLRAQHPEAELTMREPNE